MRRRSRFCWGEGKSVGAGFVELAAQGVGAIEAGEDGIEHSHQLLPLYGRSLGEQFGEVGFEIEQASMEEEGERRRGVADGAEGHADEGLLAWGQGAGSMRESRVCARARRLAASSGRC